MGSFLQDIGIFDGTGERQRPAVDGRSFARLGACLSPQRFGFELGWRQITEPLVQAAVVELAEVLHDGQLGLRSRTPDRSAISSVLKLSTKLSAGALS